MRADFLIHDIDLIEHYLDKEFLDVHFEDGYISVELDKPLTQYQIDNLPKGFEYETWYCPPIKDLRYDLRYWGR